MTATATLARTRKPVTRSAKVVRLGDAVILWITTNRVVTAYRVRPLESQMGGIAFRLEKADRGDGETEVYDVLLDGQESRCCCRGFEKYGMCKDGKGCKHIAGLSAALAAGQLPAAPKPQQVAPQPPSEAKPAPAPASLAEHSYYCPECRTHYTGAFCNCTI
jgi:hypothetical protein